METAIAAAESLDPALRAALDEVRPLHEWVPADRQTVGRGAPRE
jgi:hypothetical protein